MIATVWNKLTWYSKFEKINKPRFLREVSPYSYLGQKEGLVGNSKSIYEVC